MESNPGAGGGRIVAGTAAESEEPRDARVIREILQSMGVVDGEYEPRVVHQFLELAYRYVVDVLTDAQVYSGHAGKPSIDPDDVRLAIQSKVNFSFSQPPPREVLLELARNRNKIPLPKSIAPGSIPLPPEQDTLISPNYQLLIPWKQTPQVEETEEEDIAISNPNPNANPSFSQEQSMTNDRQEESLPQRVSFPLSAGMKRPR